VKRGRPPAKKGDKKTLADAACDLTTTISGERINGLGKRGSDQVCGGGRRIIRKPLGNC
jgi:hypothetical protein